MAQKGFVYEINATKVLKEFGLVPKNFRPAGSGHDQPDLMLQYQNKQCGCELKIAPASAGSLVLKYDDGWQFDDISRQDKEKQFLADLAKKVNLFDRIKKEWSEIPYKRKRDDLWQATAGQLAPRDRYDRDKRLFPEIRGEIPGNAIDDYYNRKNTYYLNVGTHGFYLLGRANPYKLKNVPIFGHSTNTIFRARVQYKGSGVYQFTFEMSFTMRKKSPYNIAPLRKGSVEIDMKALNLSVFEYL